MSSSAAASAASPRSRPASAAHRHHQWFAMAQLERRIAVIDSSIDGSTKLSAVRARAAAAEQEDRYEELEGAHAELGRQA
eukprot:SAG22_NODE_7494_length_734_cov_2.565354_1_plen_79_part_10